MEVRGGWRRGYFGERWGNGLRWGEMQLLHTGLHEPVL